MYQALYRKYRPRNLNDVVGQDIIVKILKNTIKNNQLSHAYLFCGPRGTGKTSVAKILAKTINCTNLQQLNPCDKCENCIDFNDKTSTDIIEIDAASNNGVDEIRELRNKINLVPNIGKYKIYIIDEVHMLTIGAFNALLKTLEEPPAHAVFILATTEPHKIPITILSRCQRFDFRKISISDIVSRLKNICEKEKIKIDEEALNLIATISDGGMRDSLSMLDKLISYTDDVITISDVNELNGLVTSEEIEKFVVDIYENNYKKIFETVDELNKAGKDFVRISEEIMKYLRNNIVESLVKEEKTEIVKKLGNDCIIKYIEQFGEILNLLKISSNPKIIFETNIIKIMSAVDESKKILPEETSFREKEKVKIETFTEKNIDNNSSVPDNRIKLLEKLKKIRIDNTLCSFDKKVLNEVKIKIENVQSYLINPDYSNVAGLVLDGHLKAASKENLIFVYDSENVELNFNLKIDQIEKMLSHIGLENYKVIATNIDECNVIKQEFNSKTKKYNYVDDSNIINDLFSEDNENSEKNSIENIFNDIIEYEK